MNYVPPFWALGHHHCRWGYKDTNHVEKIMKNYEDADIPIDTYWLDIDYM